MTQVVSDFDKLNDSVMASTIYQKKSFLFAAGWWLRAKYGFKKYPKEYETAKRLMGTRSVVFGVPRWPKKREKGPLSNEMFVFYRLMEASLTNEENNIDYHVNSLLTSFHHTYTKYLERAVCESLWWDVVAETPTNSYSHDSVLLAEDVYKKEDFTLTLAILCDSLEDCGYDYELNHLRTGRHTPACPVIRKIAGVK